MKQSDYQLVWGILLLCFGCLAASTSQPECVKNEAGECLKEDLSNSEESSSVENNAVGELTKLISSLPVPSVESFATRCRTDDPNLCSKKVKATSPPSKEWILLSDEFKALNLTFPFDFSVETQYLCCDGYAQEDADSLCLPVCTSECGVNSYCKSPNKCECYEGFLQKPNGQCVSEGEDFRADDPHVCSQKIEVNYVTSVLAPIIKHGNLKNIAELVSSPLLRQNQNKTRTEVHYSCCEEYEQKSKGELCELKPQKPTCDEECPAHSSCIADGVCQCDEGYSETSDSCQPVCDGEITEHSRCVRPGEWECDAGYIKLSCEKEPGFLCEPHCSESCPINGECTAPNVCKCRSGFVISHLADLDPTKTVEICVPDEEYGQPEFRTA